MMRRRSVVYCSTWLVDIILFTEGTGDASSRKCTYPCKMEVGDDCLNFLFVFSILNQISIRKEMQYMLHSRRKAEIEVLYTQNKSNDNGTGVLGEIYSCSSSNPILESHSWQVITGSSQKVLQNTTSRTTPSEDSSQLDIFSSSPQLMDSNMNTWSSPDCNKATESHCAPHALLMLYLEEKITGFIGAAMRRTRI